ncbi:MAG TPA: isoaspartyl peptidase/L-asparaginase [Bacteroidia bacterium]|nr:isoaspartyl peptidase/L-asparaginase [Bacteroidia bacterium]
MSKKFAVAVHGGAGTVSRKNLTADLEKQYLAGLSEAVDGAHAILETGGSALLAVEFAVRSLENNILFNAGKGSVFTNEGKHEMDAAIMDGQTIKAGAAAGVSNVRNPIILARCIMQSNEQVFLCGKGAEDFARTYRLHFENDNYFFSQYRYEQWEKIKHTNETQLDHVDDAPKGTVGAVAVDKEGNLAAATSTGGMTNKRFGRVGDTPVIGSGTYANNNTCAVSCTGHGEYFLRYVAAYDISCLIEYKGMTLKEACEFVINKKLKDAGGEGGLIAVDANANIELIFNSTGMYRGWRVEGEEAEVMIFR